jgi:hypothetical protein
MITVLANRNGLSCIQAKMIKVAASKTLAEILGELIDPRGEAHSATVYGYKTNMAEQDRVELMLDLSVAEILQCDDTIRKIRFDMCTLAAPQVVQQNASALSILMSGAHAKAKPHFPSADKLVCPGGGQKPKEMYSKLIKILQKDLKVQFRASAQEAGIKVIGDLHRLMWKLEKCATLRKLRARNATDVPHYLGTLEGSALDADGKSGGSKKAKVDVQEESRRQRISLS